ncbi:MAG TPA: hypothetical protein VGD84_04000 [Pseudonocardiaceae bacterium]
MEMLFQGWAHPLSDYARPLEDAGLVIEAIREPMATTQDGSTYSLPFHLWFRALLPI